MSLWTPDGEHPVDKNPAPSPASAAQQAPPAQQAPAGAAPEMPDGMPDFDDLSPEEQEQAREIAAEMAEAQARIAGTPANVVVANHAMGMYELAAIHLSQQEPNLAEAGLAIDAMASLVENLSGRLGENEPTLREALGQLRLVFVELSADTPAAE